MARANIDAGLASANHGIKSLGTNITHRTNLKQPLSIFDGSALITQPECADSRYKVKASGKYMQPPRI